MASEERFSVFFLDLVFLRFYFTKPSDKKMSKIYILDVWMILQYANIHNFQQDFAVLTATEMQTMGRESTAYK